MRIPLLGGSKQHVQENGKDAGQHATEKDSSNGSDSNVKGRMNGDGKVPNVSAPPTYTTTDQEHSNERTKAPRWLLWYRTCFVWLAAHLNFYRVHMIFFILTPLVFAGIMYALDQSNNSFVNILTLCVSSMTVTGLNPVLMESLTHGQQAISFFLCCIGSTSGVSLITILIRRHFFRKRFENMVRMDPKARKRARDIEEAEEREKGVFHRMKHPLAFGRRRSSSDISIREAHDASVRKQQKKRKRDRLRVDMIRRIDIPVRVNQMNVGGFLTEESKPRSSQDGSEQAVGNEPGLQNVLGTTVSRSDSPGQMSAYEERRTDPSVNSGAPSSPKQRRISILEEPSPRLRRMSLPPVNSSSSTVTQQVPARGLPARDRAAETHEEEEEGEDEEEEQVAQSVDPTPVHSSSASEAEDDENDPAEARHARSSDSRASNRLHHGRRSSDPVANGQREELQKIYREFKRVRTLDPPKPAGFTSPVASNFPRTQTIEIREPDFQRGTHTSALPQVGHNDNLRRRTGIPLERTTSKRVGVEMGRSQTREGLPRTITRNTAMTSGFGGFPNPVKIVASAARDRIATRAATVDFPRTTTLQSVHSNDGGGRMDFASGPTKAVSYISFDAVVGRNSRFYSLTSAQRDELGGVEYRALSALLKIVTAYFLLVQLIPMIIFAPIFQLNYPAVFGPQQGSMNNAGGWYAAFNVVSAYSNSGLSLLDESMTLFQTTYGWIFTLCFLILAGNTALPIFLRLTIWVMHKLTPRRSRFSETLQFLLDHPRRCFIYLFPSHQTWILVFMLIVLNCTDWICFLVLDIGTQAIDSLPIGTRMADGLLQAFAVRAAGFSIVSLSATAPALQFLYVVMMYIAVYPIALSVRSTNVYEERSLGVFNDEDSDSAIEEEFQASRRASTYFAHHARKQLAFDIWWLALALWAICIIERSHLTNPANYSYFTIFTVMFEVVSAYGTVGLSLGSPNANYSLCGDFRTLSKLILCAVMIRGRHRGLPVAIDRSILLPSDLEALQQQAEDQRMEARQRRGSVDVDGPDYSAGGNVGSPGRAPSRRYSGATMEGSSRPSRMRSNVSGGSDRQQTSSTNNADRKRANSSATGQQSISFADGLHGSNGTSEHQQQQRYGQGKGFNRYLSTIHSAATTPSEGMTREVTREGDDDDHAAQEKPRRLEHEPNEPIPSSSGSPASSAIGEKEPAPAAMQET